MTSFSTSLAFIFPGQGSQSLGMLADLADQAVISDTFADASEVLGYDLWQVIQEDPYGQLNQTPVTQPAILSASVALWRLWQAKQGEIPIIMAGHSLGEYSALVCAGSIAFSDAVDLVKFRGEYMQSAAPKDSGAMAAIIGLDDATVIAACDTAALGEVVSPVNFNSPGQVVIAGQKDAVERAMNACKDAGAKRALPLPVSVPSHCQLMLPAAQLLAKKLSSIEVLMPTIPVVQNLHGTIAATTDELLANLVAQLHQPVQWTKCIAQLAQQGVGSVVECGPGKVLTGLNKRIDKTMSAIVINDSASLLAAIERPLHD